MTTLEALQKLSKIIEDLTPAELYRIVKSVDQDEVKSFAELEKTIKRW
jgi:hypothetical protein